jgi:hypothetical protein
MITKHLTLHSCQRHCLSPGLLQWVFLADCVSRECTGVFPVSPSAPGPYYTPLRQRRRSIFPLLEPGVHCHKPNVGIKHALHAGLQDWVTKGCIPLLGTLSFSPHPWKPCTICEEGFVYGPPGGMWPRSTVQVLALARFIRRYVNVGGFQGLHEHEVPGSCFRPFTIQVVINIISEERFLQVPYLDLHPIQSTGRPSSHLIVFQSHYHILT